MSDTIAFTEEAVREYLDASIKFWRKKRDEAHDYPGTVPSDLQKERADSQEAMASHYIDAFQSVRSSLFGELLP